MSATDERRAADTPADESQTPKFKSSNPKVADLATAFPAIDENVISAVLTASSGNMEKAFDALLGMSDPDFKPDSSLATPTENSQDDHQTQQIRADELFARQLASQSSRQRTTSRSRQPDRPPRSSQDIDAENGRSFLDDDLPIIKENIIQGFNETKTKVNSFIANLRTQYTQRNESVNQNRSNSATPTRGHSTDQTRSSLQYEADPDAIAVLENDFDELQMEDHTTKLDEGASNPPGVPVKSKWQPLDDQKKDPHGGPFALGDDDI